ncbi:MAG TPA: winged helix-turn-helix domain-containing protein [Pyrinomonadaceae bacterium]|jgi:Tol biopolymer transport system component/DNA-binding winged helix-turn-helix (wHTH) protein
MSLETNGFEFEEFLLDTKEKVLWRAGKPVAITPKTFQLLLALVENHGRLVEKDELMRTVWADSYVETGNLTFTINLVRKALGDEKQNPRFIETVPRRGYRFIAEVTELAKKNGSPGDAPPIDAQTVEKIPAASSGFKKILFPAAALLLIAGVILTGFWLIRSKNFAAAPVLDAPFSSENLSTNGKVMFAALSKDGKHVVYTNGTGGDKQSVWLRQLETGSNVEIIPPSDEQYFGLVLSPDEETLYFARRPRSFREPTDIYRVSIFGGIPQKIVDGTELGWLGISPDGRQISFVRCPQRTDEFCSLYVADAADGKNERKIFSRPHPFRIGDNRFAPDGKSIAFATGTSVGSSNEFELREIELESGAERELVHEKFHDIKNLAWLPDKSALLMTASKFPNKNFRIWQVSAASGEASPLTKDSESYAVLNMNKDATAIVSTRFKEDFRIKLIPPENPSAATTLTNASAASFAPDGKIYFSSIISGNDEIWSINADGSGQRQLTNNTADEFAPIISPDNKSVFFVSNKSGSAQLWRMNTDGSNQTQMTETDGGAPVFVSPDGEWVYYRHILTSVLWRISTKSGEQQLVLNKEKPRFAFSPDGNRVAFSERQGDERILNVVSLADGQTAKTFHLADKKLILMHIVWMPDGKNLAYITANPGFVNKVLWLQTLDEETPRQIRVLGDEEICEGYGLAVAPDGKNFAVVQGGWRHDAVLLKGLR